MTTSDVLAVRSLVDHTLRAYHYADAVCVSVMPLPRTGEPCVSTTLTLTRAQAVELSEALKAPAPSGAEGATT